MVKRSKQIEKIKKNQNIKIISKNKILEWVSNANFAFESIQTDFF